jgi:hypothetical protein
MPCGLKCRLWAVGFLPVAFLVGVALALPSINSGLWADDYVILGILSGSDGMLAGYPSRLDVFNFFDGDHERTQRLLDLGVLPWWTDPHIKMGFWRPVAALSHWVDTVAWRDSPGLMHLQNVLWFGLLIAVTAHAYQRFMGLVPAAIATLFYVLGAAHAGPCRGFRHETNFSARFLGRPRSFYTTAGGATVGVLACSSHLRAWG